MLAAFASGEDCIDLETDFFRFIHQVDPTPGRGFDLLTFTHRQFSEHILPSICANAAKHPWHIQETGYPNFVTPEGRFIGMQVSGNKDALVTMSEFEPAQLAAAPQRRWIRWSTNTDTPIDNVEWPKDKCAPDWGTAGQEMCNALTHAVDRAFDFWHIHEARRRFGNRR